VIKDIMSYFQPTRPNAMPTIVKNLIIINVLFFIATLVFEGQGIDLIRYLGMFPVQSDYFMPHQVVTHMFMHGGWQHILFNMFALWMFGSILENVWGPKRFLLFYFLCGLGAAVIHLLILSYFSAPINIFLNKITKNSPNLFRNIRQNLKFIAVFGVNNGNCQIV
jgi:membrane associated rhomboid family serine protease